MFLTFGLTVAAGKADAHADAVMQELHEQPLPLKPCVLVVDDDPNVRTAVSQMLQVLGYEAAEAAGGTEAFDCARMIHPDVVLMDLMMPEMDGFTAALHLKRDAVLASIPI